MRKTSSDLGTFTIKEFLENVHLLQIGRKRKIYLIGTAHISEESVKLVERVINKVKPDTIFLELDSDRFQAIENQDRYNNLDLISIIRQGQLFFLIGQFILSSFQKRMSEQTGVEPGSEFKKAIHLAHQLESRIVLSDRKIAVTLKRAWRMTSFWRKVKLFVSIMFSGEEKIGKQEIESMKEMDAISELVENFASELPEIKKVLIDERDTYLAHSLAQEECKIGVAVVGAGHVPGILKKINSNISSREIEDITHIPDPSSIGKWLSWLIPALIFFIFIGGFFQGEYNKLFDAFYVWVFVTGMLSALGTLIALGHPITILAGFLAAPVTTLHPAIGVGMVTAIVQAFLVKPRVMDLKELSNFKVSLRNIYKNRVTKIFLIFLLSSLGASAGTFIALPYVTKILF